MARVTVVEVRVILPAATQLTDAQIQAAIDAATVVVDSLALGCMLGATDDQLKQVELYLSAHYAAATENTLSLQSEKDPCCGGEVTYGFKFGDGIMGTPFGQMANTLSNGCLAGLDNPKKAGLLTIGCI